VATVGDLLMRLMKRIRTSKLLPFTNETACRVTPISTNVIDGRRNSVGKWFVRAAEPFDSLIPVSHVHQPCSRCVQIPYTTENSAIKLRQRRNSVVETNLLWFIIDEDKTPPTGTDASTLYCFTDRPNMWRKSSYVNFANLVIETVTIPEIYCRMFPRGLLYWRALQRWTSFQPMCHHIKTSSNWSLKVSASIIFCSASVKYKIG